MERHTRQGEPSRATAQVRGLDEYEPRDWAPRPSVKGGSAQRLRTIAAGGCWCGQSVGHDWPGKADGAPHPRPLGGATLDWWEDVLARLVRRGLPYSLVQEVWGARQPHLAAKLVRATDTQLREVADAWRRQQRAAS